MVRELGNPLGNPLGLPRRQSVEKNNNSNSSPVGQYYEEITRFADTASLGDKTFFPNGYSKPIFISEKNGVALFSVVQGEALNVSNRINLLLTYNKKDLSLASNLDGYIIKNDLITSTALWVSSFQRSYSNGDVFGTVIPLFSSISAATTTLDFAVIKNGVSTIKRLTLSSSFGIGYYLYGVLEQDGYLYLVLATGSASSPYTIIFKISTAWDILFKGTQLMSSGALPVGVGETSCFSLGGRLYSLFFRSDYLDRAILTITNVQNNTYIANNVYMTPGEGGSFVYIIPKTTGGIYLLSVGVPTSGGTSPYCSIVLRSVDDNGIATILSNALIQSLFNTIITGSSGAIKLFKETTDYLVVVIESLANNGAGLRGAEVIVYKKSDYSVFRHYLITFANYTSFNMSSFSCALVENDLIIGKLSTFPNTSYNSIRIPFLYQDNKEEIVGTINQFGNNKTQFFTINDLLKTSIYVQNSKYNGTYSTGTSETMGTLAQTVTASDSFDFTVSEFKDERVLATRPSEIYTVNECNFITKVGIDA